MTGKNGELLPNVMVIAYISNIKQNDSLLAFLDPYSYTINQHSDITTFITIFNDQQKVKYKTFQHVLECQN